MPQQGALNMTCLLGSASGNAAFEASVRHTSFGLYRYRCKSYRTDAFVHSARARGIVDRGRSTLNLDVAEVLSAR